MKLKVTREGGFVPQIVEKQVDVKNLPTKFREVMNSMASELKDNTAQINPLNRDGFKYTLEWSGKKNGKVQFDDTTIPSHLSELVGFVLKK